MDDLALVADPSDARRWRLTGADPALVPAMNAYLGYLADRNYSPRTVRTLSLIHISEPTRPY